MTGNSTTSSTKPFQILGFGDENIEPLETPENEVASKNKDIVRGMILCGLVRKLLTNLSQAQDFLNSKNNSSPRTLEQLRSEIESLHVKIAAEDHRNQDFAAEMSTIKDSCVEKSDNIQKEILKLKQFCEHFRSRSFVENYNNEKMLTQLTLDLKMESELRDFLEARLAVEREKKQKLIKLLHK